MTPLDRRRFLELGAGAAAAAVAGPFVGRGAPTPGVARAAAPLATDRPPGFHRFRLGEMEVTVLNDGYFHLPAEVHAPDQEKEERDRYYASRHLPTDAIPGQLCPVLIDTGSKRILVDTGMGPAPDFAPDTGRLERALPLIDVPPEAIDLVVLTHAHGDHIGGLLDPETGASRFPNAEVVISRPELDFWTAPDAASRLPDWTEMFGGAEAFVAGIVGVLNALDDRLRPIDPGQEIASGVHSVDSAGHTPGHIALLAESKGEQLLLVGDAVVSVHVGLERPRWRFLFDQDGEEGIRSRVHLLDRAAADGLLLSGYHFPFPGVGRVVRDGRSYRWLPDVLS